MFMLLFSTNEQEIALVQFRQTSAPFLPERLKPKIIVFYWLCILIKLEWIELSLFPFFHYFLLLADFSTNYGNTLIRMQLNAFIFD